MTLDFTGPGEAGFAKILTWYWEKYDFQDRADRSLGCEVVVKKALECRIRTFLPDLVVSIKKMVKEFKGTFHCSQLSQR